MGEYAVGVATRNKILQVCKELFYEKGIKKTSYDDICERASVNRGLIPYYFKSKNNIAIEVLEDFIQGMVAAIDQRWSSDVISLSERIVMIELLMFRLLSSDENVCRFYSEIQSDASFHDATFATQDSVMRDLAQASGVEVTDAALRTITCMVEGTEAELVQAVHHGLLLESVEDMVRRDTECCFFLLGVNMEEVKVWIDHAYELAEGRMLVCNEYFECKVK